MNRNQGNLQLVVPAIHSCAWLYVFVTPILFKGPTDTYNWYMYIRGCTVPLISIAVFYLNYYIWSEKYFLTGRTVRYLFTNLLTIIVAVTLEQLILRYILPMPPEMRRMPSWTQSPMIMLIFYTARGMLTYSFMTLFSLALSLAMHWKDAENALQKAELESLKSKINPHFLLNTLNNIYSLTTFAPERAQVAILQLSQILRDMLYYDSSQPIKLTDQLFSIEQYIELMKLRVTDNVDVKFNWKLPQNCQHEIMPHIFVGLVENAFKHGVKPLEKCFVHVTCIHDDDGTIIFCVENSNFPKSSNDKTPGGLGIRQVARQLELSYPGSHIWQYGPSNDGKVYKAEIRILPQTKN